MKNNTPPKSSKFEEMRSSKKLLKMRKQNLENELKYQNMVKFDDSTDYKQ